MNSQNNFFKNYFYNTFYQVFTVIAPLITTPYITRVLGANKIGQYSYVNSIATYFGLFGVLGVITYGQLEVAKNQHNKESLSRIFWSVFISRSITMAIVVCIFLALASICNVRYKTIWYLHVIFFMAQWLDISWFLQGLEDFKTIALRNFIVKVLGIIMVFVFVKNELDVHKYVFILLGTVLIGNMLLLLYPIKKIFCYFPSINDICSTWKRSVVFFIPTIASSIYTVLDKTMLGCLYKSVEQNGYYEESHKIEQVLVMVITSLSAVLLPRMTKLYSEGAHKKATEILKKSFSFTMCISIPMSIGIATVSPVFVPVFFGDDFLECISLLRIFCVLVVIVSLDNLIGKQYLMACGLQNRFNIGVICGAIVNLILNYLLIPKYAAVGAAIASVVAEAIILLIFIFLSRTEIKYKILFPSFFRYLVSALIMATAINFFTALNVPKIALLFIQICIGGLIYIILLVLLQDEFIVSIMNYIKKKMEN